MKRLIINCDDFGWSRDAVDSIISLHKKGITNSTSVMTNMPGFKYGAEELKKYPELGAGVHLSMFDGKPVLPAEKVPTLIDNSTGEFLSFAKVSSNKKRINPEQAAAEYEAQIQKFFDAGLKPTHLDVHTSLPYQIPKLFELILCLNKKYGLPMRTLVGKDLKEKSRALAKRQKVPAIFIRYWGRSLIGRIEKAGIEHPDFFIPEFSNLDNKATVEQKLEQMVEILGNIKDGVTEILTHPSLADERWRQVENAVWNEKIILGIIKRENLEISSYRIFHGSEKNV